MDGIFLSKLIPLLRDHIIGRRLIRVRQISRTKFSFEFGKGKVLIVSIHPMFYRVSLESLPRAAGHILTPLIMKLRKCVQGGFIRDISHVPYERTIFFHIENTDEVGNEVNYKLAVELMGQFSNLILLDTEDVILSAARQKKTRYREIMPGVGYVVFGGNRLLPDAVKAANLKEIISNSTNTIKALTSRISGISKISAQEIIYRAGLISKLPSVTEEEANALQNALMNYLEECRDSKCVYLYRDERDNPVTISFCELHHLTARYEVFRDVFEGIERYFQTKESIDEFMRVKERVLSSLRKEFEDTEDTLYKVEGDLRRGEDYGRYKLYGDLLSMHYGEIEKGTKEVTLSDYEGNRVTIPLDPALNLAQNVSRYYERYKRMKRKMEFLKERITSLKGHLNDVEKRLKEAEACEDIDKLREMEGRLSKAQTPRRGETNRSTPREFFKDGYTILVGKSNKQNDELTFKIAKKDDVWLHTQAIPGSHVIIRNPDKKEIPFEVLKYAASLAVTYSKAKRSSNVPVDYTKVKNVWKPRGAKPGFVLYRSQKTLFADPLDRP